MKQSKKTKARKWIWLIAIVIILSFSITAFAMSSEQENTNNPESTKRTEPPAETTQSIPPTSSEPEQELQELSSDSGVLPKRKEEWNDEWMFISSDSILAFVDESKECDASKGIYDVPVYYEEELLFNTGGLYYISRDSSFWEGRGHEPHATVTLLLYFPTSAVRDMGNGMRYLMYDTETGYRLYLHLSDRNRYFTTTGFPIIIGKEMHSYDAFQSLAVGDTIDKVAAIDPVASLIKKEIMEVWELDPAGAHGHAKKGYPVTTVHYLQDGILKIEYDMKDDRTLYITDMVYNENYELVNPKGRTVNYRIAQIDLPTTKLDPKAQSENSSQITDSADSKVPLKKKPWNPATTNYSWEDCLAFIEKEKQNDVSKGVQDIPVYIEEELLFKTDNLFHISLCSLGIRECLTPKNSTKRILKSYPTTAIRDRGDGMLYLMYAMDTGKRMYLHLSDYNGYETPAGFPILIGEKVLSYKDFQSLKVGDTIDKVEAIDPIAALITKDVKDTLWLADSGVYNRAQEGCPISSVHYLKDGILKIEYVTTAESPDGNALHPLCIYNIIYNENYELVNPLGRTVNYRIEEIDLPKS